MPPSTPALRRFSFGGRASELVDIAVWQFDVVWSVNSREIGRTCYVKFDRRADCLDSLFERYPTAKVLGTGYPMTERDATQRIGRELGKGEILLVDDCAGVEPEP